MVEFYTFFGVHIFHIGDIIKYKHMLNTLKVMDFFVDIVCVLMAIVLA